MVRDHDFKKDLKVRVAVFQYEWPLQNYTKDLVILLAERNIQTDLFCFKTDKFNFADIETGKNLKVIKLTNSQFKLYRHSFIIFNLILKVINKLRWISYRKKAKLFTGTETNLIDISVLIQSSELLKKKKYHWYIGVEKKGLIWAGILSGIYNVPFLYCSLELYIEDHPAAETFEPGLRDAERKYHKQAKATLIQDEFRGMKLHEANKVENKEMLFLPVGSRGSIISEKNDKLRRRFGLENKMIIVYFGMISKERFCSALAEASHHLRDNMVIILHGFGDKKYLEELKNSGKQDSLFISDEMISESELTELVASADIGIALYQNDFSNDRLTAFSSQKIALYCQCGVPFVSFRNESYEKLQGPIPCCELIDDELELPNALIRIAENYPLYRLEAFDVFNKCYSTDNNIISLIHFLKKYF